MRIGTPFALCAAITALLAATPVAARAQVAHTVEPGESLWSIAALDGISVDELAVANGLPPDARLQAGATILIPPVSAVPSTVNASRSGTGQCVWHCGSAVHPHPTDETVTPGEVGSIAAEYGMSPALVESIASNESGFDNSAVSSAGARGVMQITPDTWSFIDDQLAERPLNPVSATDNVEAGVIYLHFLYHLEGGDGDATVSAYFQGPNRETLLPETKTYVREVRDDERDFARGGG